ncbi:MAG: sugar ABC transporter permease [Candidatus Cohnella colombiensis]|uniref:Sugar ABC transporter permease n=1 Tax=Candidatus Cohnella colombiensis TaxID=3121368 RepID=A0AA95EXH7_9BACL|nr:MAG: sugar ABC transporter permease [Cohnella sp.]
METRKINVTKFRWSRFKEGSGNYAFLVPALLFLAVFMIYPIVYNIILSFKDVTVSNIQGEQHFVGFRNYAEELKSAAFMISLKNSTLFTGLSLIFQFAIGFMLALFFNYKFPARNLFRSLMLVAWVIPSVISGSLFKWMFAGEQGIVNYILIVIGVINEPITWLTDQNFSLASTIISNIWLGIPFNMLILLAGLQSLPEDVYEAGKMDGANPIQRFFFITLPMLKSTIYILLVLGFIYTFKVFDLILVMTNGGPVNSSSVLPLHAYNLAFVTYDFSRAATVAGFMLIIVIVVSIGYLKLIRSEEE